MSDRELRRAQTISPYGAGALLDISGEGFVVNSIDKWNPPPKVIIEMPRLSRAVGGYELRSFSDEDRTKEAVRVSRFPKWLHCQSCKKLIFLSKKEDNDNNYGQPVCLSPSCNKRPLDPMRFVAYCDNGHLTEIDWARWCHFGQGDAEFGYCKDKSQLYFTSTGKYGGDFHSMKVTCKACNRSRNLADIAKGEASPYVLQDWPLSGQNCCGRQPWQYDQDRVECKESMRIEPRGSSSLYSATIYSALDVEIQSKDDNVSYASLDELLEDALETEPTRQGVEIDIELGRAGRYFTKIKRRAGKLNITFEQAQDYLLAKLTTSDDTEILVDEAIEDTQSKILSDELALFRLKKDIDQTNFKVQFPTLKDTNLTKLSNVFSGIGQVRKLREVRVNNSFKRGKGLLDVLVSVSEQSVKWLPAIEAFGEGIYFELNSKTLSKFLFSYEKALDDLVRPQQEALVSLKENYPVDYPSSKLFLIAHTLSHLLIRQLTFNSGYSSAALRERIYIDDNDNYAGILIYTTDTDSEGTMGGLVDQARANIISKLILQITESASWCSSDPVCRETMEQGLHNLNRSACHCCSLISETSCVYQNAMLNRLILGGMGSAKKEILGFLPFAIGGSF
jgi:hypothetical protein